MSPSKIAWGRRYSFVPQRVFKDALPAEARNRKLIVFAVTLLFFFCVLWAYFVAVGGLGTNRGLQQAKFEE